MLSIKEYYSSDFRNDIASFMGNSSVPYFGHSWEYDCQGLESVSIERRHLFLICLYFTVLVDQVMYSYYKNYYSKFKELTQYPKFCHGLGQHHKNPRAILYLPVDKGLVDKKLLVECLENGMELFVEETVNFISKYTPGIEINDFFNKLVYDPDIQIPEIFVMLDSKVKDNVDYVAYRALVKAIKSITSKSKQPSLSSGDKNIKGGKMKKLILCLLIMLGSAVMLYANDVNLAPDSTYVGGGSPQLAPDNTYVGGKPSLAPDGTYVAGNAQLAPDGTYVGGTPQLAPDGTYVGGRPMLAPDGSYVGDGGQNE